MRCKTTRPNGKEASKKAYDTLDEAIHEAKMLNAEPNQFRKLVSYKCDECHKYHIGRGPKAITEKERQKYQDYANLHRREQLYCEDYEAWGAAQAQKRRSAPYFHR